MTIAAELDKAISAVCPIYGVSIGRVGDKSTWRIDFTEEATDEQRAAAASVLAAFDPASAIAAQAVDPIEKLRAFLDQNPDVKKIIG